VFEPSAVPLTYFRLPEPYLLFRLRKRFTSPRDGLRLAGPLDADARSRDEVHLGLIAERALADRARKLATCILRGGDRFYRGFEATFKVRKLVLSDEYVKTVDLASQGEPMQALEGAYVDLAERLPPNSAVILAVNDRLLERGYHRLKALRFSYTAKTVRLQLIGEGALDRVLSDRRTLDLALINIATSLYAKTGGTPWLLEQALLPAGVFVGIAFSHPRRILEPGAKGEIFYYGVLTVHNKFGKYIGMVARGVRLGLDSLYGTHRAGRTKGLYIPEDEMRRMLESILEKYQPPVVVLHKSSWFNEEEEEAARSVLESRGVSYALIHVKSSNPYRGYGEERLSLNPVRGDVVLDEEAHRAILFTTGCVQGKEGVEARLRPGTPRPLELVVQENGTPFGLEWLARQVLGLTKLDWNTTDVEVRAPVTLKYAGKLARIMPYISSKYSSTTSVDVRDLM